MKISSLAVGLSAVVGSLANVSYEGAKAVRVAVGEDVIPLLDVITKLELSTWKGMAEGLPVANGFVDLVVPADKVSVFDELTSSFTTEIMHEDLGLAIAEESRGPAYICKSLVCYCDSSLIVDSPTTSFNRLDMVGVLPSIFRAYQMAVRLASIAPNELLNLCCRQLC